MIAPVLIRSEDFMILRLATFHENGSVGLSPLLLVELFAVFMSVAHARPLTGTQKS
jgi:hypothetical protein